jgi:hypothetical protein
MRNCVCTSKPFLKINVLSALCAIQNVELLREVAERQFRVYNLGHVIATGNYMRITVMRNFAAGKIA